MTGIRLIVGTLDIAVTKRLLEVRGDLAAPLLRLCCLLRRLDRLLDLGEGSLVALGDQAGNGILLVAAVDALRLPDVRIADAAGNDNFGCGCVIVCY